MVHQPRQADKLADGLFTFQQEGRTTVVPYQTGNLLSRLQITSQITQHATRQMFALDRMFRGCNPTCFRINSRSQRLSCIMKQRRE